MDAQEVIEPMRAIRFKIEKNEETSRFAQFGMWEGSLQAGGAASISIRIPLTVVAIALGACVPWVNRKLERREISPKKRRVT